MKIFSVSFLFFLLILNGFSQTNSGIIKYKVNYTETDNELNDNDLRYKNFIASFKDGFNFLEYSLYFNSNESRFELLDIMDIDQNRLIKRASIYAGSSTIYINLNDSLFLKTIDFLGDLYLVDFNHKHINWKITNEKKQIEKFTCYKAEAVINMDNGQNAQVKVIAWFTPQIPVPFGPDGYYGLPGLILELHEKGLVFYGTEIKLDNKTKVRRPTRGIRIKENDLNRKIDSTAKKLFKIND